MSTILASERSFDVRSAALFRRSCLALGLLISAVMVARSQVGGDQLSLLARGWLLAERAELVPYGIKLSNGGFHPGPATSILIGLPLLVWRHHLAPVVLIWLTHLAAWFLLDRRLRLAATPWERAAFAVVYWMNPWRLEAAGLLWNPNFLFLAGALHFATAFDQRQRATFSGSFVHVLTLGLAAQLHPAVLLLIVGSLLLAGRGAMRVHWPGVLAGASVAVVALIPWLSLLRSRPEIFQSESGFLFRSLVYVQPWIKGLSYWLRYPSLAVSHRSATFDFTALAGPTWDRWLTGAATILVVSAGAATLVVALVANLDFFLKRLRAKELPPDVSREAREFLHRYVFACAAGAILVFAASPTTPQSWQAFPLFHATAIPVALWAGTKLESADVRRIGRARRLLLAAAIAAACVAIALTLGAPSFRCGGRDAERYPLAADSPMLEDLSLQRTCSWPTRVTGGWWPHGLPKE